MAISNDQIFKYLQSKIPSFLKTTKSGAILFTCPNVGNHKFPSKAPSATFIPESNKINCLICGFKGTMFDAIRVLEEDKKNQSDAEITNYLINSMQLDTYKELDNYHTYGWSLVPNLKNDKKPFEKDWTNIEHKEKMSWIKWLNNGLNIGLNCGLSKIMAVDVDFSVKESPERNELIALLIETKTLMQETPHGKHFVFKINDIPQQVNIAGLKIDTRCDGGQIVIAPSIKDNLSYRWINLGDEIKEMPIELKEKLLSLIKNTKKVDVSNIEIVNDNKFPELKNNNLDGCCNDTFIRMGGVFINKFTLEQTEFILNVMNRNLLSNPMPNSSIQSMLTSLSGYRSSDEETQEKSIYEYMKLVQNDVSARDIMDSLKLSRAIVDKWLSKFVKDGKAVRMARGRYQYKEKVEWSDQTPELVDEYQYKIPLFNNIAIFQNKDVLLLGARTNDGKCVSNGYLSTNKGLIDIEDIGKIRPEGISKDKGCHIRLFTGKLQDKAYRKPNYFWKEKVNETIKIVTEYGYELEATPNHKILVLSKNFKNGQYKTEFKTLKDIEANEEILIVSPKHNSKKIKNYKKNFTLEEFKHTTNIKQLTQPLNDLTPELARLVGYIIGDGTLVKNSIRIFINNQTEKNTIANDVESILSIYGLKPTYKVNNNCLSININSSILLKWFKRRILKQSIYLQNLKSPDRYIPKCILQGNEEIQRQFIGALFSCESNLDKGTALEITMASKKIIDALHIMLLNFGIFTKKGEKKIKQYPDNKYWRISISSEMGFKFFSIFNPIKYKDKILPTEIKKKSRIKTFGNNQFYKDVYFVDKIQTKLYLNEEKYVYDFNIESKKYNTNNQFWCNGFVNHNTTIALNILAEIIKQGIKPYYIYSEAGSRFQKTSQALEIAGKYYHTYHENPLAIELEYNAFSIIDWLHLEHKENTDTVLKHLNNELQRKGGILVIFTQLKQTYEFFAPNLIDHYPTFAARYIQDNETKTLGHWDIQKIKEPRGNYCNYVLPCTYDQNTKIFKVQEMI